MGAVGPRERRLPGAVGASRRLRDARPLSGLPSDGAHPRAPERGRDEPRAGASGRGVQRPRRLRGGLSARVRLAGRSGPGRAHGRRAERREHGQRLACAGRREHRRPGRARRRAPFRRSAGAMALRRMRTRALVAGFPLAVATLNRAGLGPLRAEISQRRAAPRGPSGDGRGGGAARPGRRVRGVRPHPPRRAPARRSGGRVARAPGGRNGRGRRPPGERRLLGLRSGLSHPHPRREPLLAGNLRARRGLRATRASSGCSSTEPTPSSGRRGRRAVLVRPRPA